MQKYEATTSVAEFSKSVEIACRKDSRTTIEQAIALLEQACVHPLQERLQGLPPVERLKLLRAKLPETNIQFYNELLKIFAEIGDRHTQCHLPKPFLNKAAFLPFLTKEIFEDGERKLIVCASATDELKKGEGIISWNGVSIGDYLQQHMVWQLGANFEARRAKAVQTLTFRPLAFLPFPEEEALVEILDLDGQRCKRLLQWRVADNGILKKRFAPLFKANGESAELYDKGFQARPLETTFGTFGYIRIATFQKRPATFLSSFVEALTALPDEGLILDLRGCEDGFVQTAEQLLQLFTAKKISPQAFQFRVTKLIRQIVRDSAALQQWAEAVEEAVSQGEDYSAWRPLTMEAEANSIGQKYFGRVVLLVDALTYSSAEMFAAGFQDHRIGLMVGTADSTGGGGASPWHQETIFQLSQNPMFRAVPDAPTFRVAVRRCKRALAQSVRLLEGVGVQPEVLQRLTRADILDEDANLLEKAGKVLAEKAN